MASLSQGFTISPMPSESYSVTWQKGGGLPTSRARDWSDSLGSFTIESFQPISSAYGAVVDYSVGGLTGKAVCTSVGGSAQVNDAIRYTATFTILS